MTRRIVMASVRHESNTFSPVITQLEHFNRDSPDGSFMTGQHAIDVLCNLKGSFAGLFDGVQGLDAEVCVPCVFSARPQGPVISSAFEEISARLLSEIARGCDALLLDAHGAMVSEPYPDAEGELLRRVRALAPGLPIAVALDFHANVSETFMDNATVIAGYRTYPHVDTFETGQRASRVLVKALEGDVDPVLSWGSLPLLTHMEKQTPSCQPMKDIMDRAIQAEADGSVILATVLGGFPVSDVPHLGLTAVVLTDNNKRAGDGLRDELLHMAWQRRSDFQYDLEPIAVTIARAKASEGRPIVMVDHGDNYGAGAQTDLMDVLAEVIRQNLQDVCAGPFCDPGAVQTMIEAGEGADISLRLGGKTDIPALGIKARPLEVSGTVKSIRNAALDMLPGDGPDYFKELGPTAVLDLGAMRVLISSQPYEPSDPGCFFYANLDVFKEKFILIKSRQNFRAGFEPIASDVIMVAGPGVGNSDFSALPYTKIPRPIFPIDPGTPYKIVSNRSSL